MKTWIVDSSIGVKWLPMFQSEPLVAEAQSLRTRWENGEIILAVPDLFWVEAGATLWKAARRKTCRTLEVEAALKSFLGLEIATFRTMPLMEDALRIANSFERTVYDSLYIALAQSLRTDFVTADENLANAVGSRLPVRWIGTTALEGD